MNMEWIANLFSGGMDLAMTILAVCMGLLLIVLGVLDRRISRAKVAHVPQEEKLPVRQRVSQRLDQWDDGLRNLKDRFFHPRKKEEEAHTPLGEREDDPLMAPIQEGFARGQAAEIMAEGAAPQADERTEDATEDETEDAGAQWEEYPEQASWPEDEEDGEAWAREEYPQTAQEAETQGEVWPEYPDEAQTPEDEEEEH
ncbi:MULTISPECIES: hypothetical protein [unclassified Clostridium]|uniref:hypothetical protein n=1 Tax=unclassified Clostridium TaxID=2614128 RepID=UPI0014858696|nr:MULTISPECIES: hypothetical protein [unclassified Clostridium]